MKGAGRLPEGGTYKQQEVTSYSKGRGHKSGLQNCLDMAVRRHLEEGYISTCFNNPCIIAGPITDVHADGCQSMRKDQIILIVFS